jgi:hypothetical protein
MKYKDKYKVEWKIKGIYANGRYYPKRQIIERSSYPTLTGRFGAKGMKKHLNEVYGRNLKYFKIKKL